MESIIMGLLGLFGVTDPLVTVDIQVDIQINIPGAEREAEDYVTIDDLFIERSYEQWRDIMDGKTQLGETIGE